MVAVFDGDRLLLDRQQRMVARLRSGWGPQTVLQRGRSRTRLKNLIWREGELQLEIHREGVLSDVLRDRDRARQDQPTAVTLPHFEVLHHLHALPGAGRVDVVDVGAPAPRSVQTCEVAFHHAVVDRR